MCRYYITLISGYKLLTFYMVCVRRFQILMFICRLNEYISDIFLIGFMCKCKDFIKFNKVLKRFFKTFFTMCLTSRHGCISDASLRRLTQCLRDVSDRADLQISETSLMRSIKGVSSEMSVRCLASSRRHL